MVLTNEQILEYIQNPHNPYIEQWQKEHTLLDLFYNGGDVSEHLRQVKNYENTEQRKLRQDIARSTKDFLSNLLKPLGKVFTASGFVTEIQTRSVAVKDNLDAHFSALPDGFSLTKWMERYWQEYFVTDPNALLFIETETIDGLAKSYPTYKSINVIHDYRHKWGKFDYVIFLFGEVELDNETVKVYRVYDDSIDGLFYVKNDELYPLPKFAGGEPVLDENEDPVPDLLFHNSGFVPAVLVSDIVDNRNGGRKSFIHKIDELLQEYMRDASVHSIYKFLHGFPIFWRYATKCTTCNGTGKVENPKKDQPDEPAKITCPTCKGKTVKVTNDVSDGVTLPIPSVDDPKIAPDIAGYIQPALETWKMQLDELLAMRKEMHFAIWNTYVMEDERSNTATGRIIDAQPVNETLKNISETAEKVEERLMEYIGRLMYPDFFTSARRKYGKHYLIQTPDILWQKYLEAKEQQAPVSTLDYMFKQYLMAEYHHDLVMLEYKLKEFYLEPFPHYKLSDLQSSASPKQLQRKILFSEWTSQSQVDFGQDLEALKADFEAFLKQNMDELKPEVNATNTEVQSSSE